MAASDDPKIVNVATAINSRAVESIAILAIIFVAANARLIMAQGSRPEWVRTYSLSAASTNQARSIFLTRDGGVAVCGSSVNAQGNADYLVIKYNVEGTEVWTRRYDSSAEDRVSAVAMDSSGNILITGSSRTIKIRENGSIAWVAPYSGAGVVATDGFAYVTGFRGDDWATVQLRNDDATGEAVWTRFYDGAAHSTDVATAIALTGQGVVIAGTESVYNPVPAAANVALSATKYSESGGEDWHRIGPVVEMIPPTFMRVEYLAVATSGELYFTVVLGGDRLLTKFDSSGAFAWQTNLMMDFVGGVSMGQHQNILVPGSNGDGIVTMFNANGSVIWSQSHTSLAGGRSEIRSVDVGVSGDIFGAGFTLRTPADNDIVIMKMSPAGAKLGTWTYDSPHHGSDFANDMVMDARGNIYVTGYSTTPQGGSEFVTLKYSPAPKIEKQPNGAMHLEFRTSPGQQYALEATSNFFDWQSLITNTADASGVVQFDDNDAPTIPYRFYRARTAP